MTWARWFFYLDLIATAVSLSGCVPPVEPPAAHTFTPLLAAVGGAVVTLDDAPAPGPAPPTPGPGPRKCEACDGKGEVGDGTIKIICNICGGDGVLDGAAQDTPPGDGVVAGPAAVETPGSDDTDGDALNAAGQASGELQADSLTPLDLDAFHFASEDYSEALAANPGATPLLVFYWPSESEKAKTAVRNLEKRNDGQYVVIPLCLSDQWDTTTYVAEHWKRHTRQVVLIDGQQETRIVDLKQLEP